MPKAQVNFLLSVEVTDKVRNYSVTIRAEGKAIAFSCTCQSSPLSPNPAGIS